MKKMRILWIVGEINLFPEAVSLLDGKSTEIKSTGGWITASANMLADSHDVDLAVAMANPKVSAVRELQGKEIKYYVIPKSGTGHWRKALEEFKPDIVHIHGTENYKNILAFLNECGKEKMVVSIQGVPAPIAKYCYAGLSWKDRLINTTIGDIKRKRIMFYDRHLDERVENSEEIIKRAYHVIGRTSCDRSYVWSISPNIKYYFCNETLREDFYTGCWSYSNCIPHTIFLSQASRPLKGLFLLLQALPLVKREFPDVKVKMAGDKFAVCETLKDKIKQSGYGKYINKLINKLDLKDSIVFLGALNAEEMKHEYLKANFFLSCSTIENSPNSLCEAQMLGVPCLSSYVGGAPDMIPNNNCGELYRFDDIDMLAYKICKMFENSADFDSTEMRTVAHERHNASQNVRRLKDIYTSIVNE